MISPVHFMKKIISLTIYKTLCDLKSESSKTYIGYFWWILEPLLQLAIYYVFFTYIFSAKEQNYALFLFIGLVSWRWFQTSVIRSANSLIINRNMTCVIDINKLFFPLETVCVDVIKYLLALLLVIVMLCCFGFIPGIHYLELPLLIFQQFLFTLGCAMIASALTPFFPDLYMLLITGLQLLMFMSGIFYSVNTIPGILGEMLKLNPMAIIINDYRRILLQDQSLTYCSELYVLCVSIVFILIGFAILKKYNKRYPKIG